MSPLLKSTGIAVACLLTGCPDTSVPKIGGPPSATRVCSADELGDFRAASYQDVRTDLWVAFVDVGQGDAIWIRTPGELGLDAQEILVDAGDCSIKQGDCGIPAGSVPDSTTEVDGVGALEEFMRESGWGPGAEIDYLVVTHPDKDHYGGAWRILQDYQVGAFIDPGIESGNSTYQALLVAASAEPGIELLRPAMATGIQASRWGDQLDVDLLSANQDVQNDNDGSIVLKLTYRGKQILLTGDSETSLDDRLVALHGAGLKADVLKAGHHGGMGTNTDRLLDMVFSGSGRKFAIISSGRRDNLPAQAPLDRLLERVGPSGLYRTDRGDESKSRTTAPGDDHILVRVSDEGVLTVCYAKPDRTER